MDAAYTAYKLFLNIEFEVILSEVKLVNKERRISA